MVVKISRFFGLKSSFSRSINDFKSNFDSHSKSNCPVCPLCKSAADTQEHALKCFVLKKHMNSSEIEALQAVEYNYIFGNIEGQFKVTQVFQAIINLRERLRQGKMQNVAYPFSNSGPGG